MPDNDIPPMNPQSGPGLPPNVAQYAAIAKQVVVALHSLLTQGAGGFNIAVPVTFTDEDGHQVQSAITPAQLQVNLVERLQELIEAIDDLEETVREASDGDNRPAPRRKRKRRKD